MRVCGVIRVLGVLEFNLLVFVQSDKAHLHSLSLVRSCIQKAVSLLRDTNNVTSRSMQRIRILLTLLGTGTGQIGGKCSHLKTALFYIMLLNFFVSSVIVMTTRC